MTRPWVDDASAPLLTDLYELTMLQAYFDAGLNGPAVFDLFVRRLPPTRNYLVACGLEDVLGFFERLSFDSRALAHLRSVGRFTDAFLDSLAELRFTGDVYAMPEGTPFFALEPILEVVAPVREAQLVETFVMNQMHFQTVAASKAARVVAAAAGRPVVDFGLRRMHGSDAGMKAARAFFVGGVAATSNVLAGRLYGIPIAGTLAHSFIQAFGEERESFRRFLESYPESTLLVDTYDTLEGVRNVIRVAHELGPAFRARGIRLDSGDLSSLAREARRLLDEAGLARLEIVASGGLDEDEIAKLLAEGAPIDGFGVGSRMAVSSDAPYLDMAYKLASYAGENRIKLSPKKGNLPGLKQVFRGQEGDVIGFIHERLPGRPLLEKVMEGGRRGAPFRLEEARARLIAERNLLPRRLLALEPADPPHPVRLSPALEAEVARLRAHPGG